MAAVRLLHFVCLCSRREDNRHEKLQRCEVEGGCHDTVVVHRGPNRLP